MAGELGSAVSSVIPSKAEILSGTSTGFIWLTIFFVIIIIMVLGGIGIWILIRALQFNKKIDIYEDRNGRAEWVGKDRAREVVYSKMGDSVFFLKKRRKYLPRGEIKVGKNRYVYLIRPDGEFINIAIKGVDYKDKTIGVSLIHPEMRAFKDGMDKLMEDRFKKKSLLKDYLPLIIPIVLFIICGLVLYFVADRLVAFLDKMPGVIDAMNKVADRLNEVLASTNNICSNAGLAK